MIDCSLPSVNSSSANPLNALLNTISLKCFPMTNQEFKVRPKLLTLIVRACILSL